MIHSSIGMVMRLAISSTLRQQEAIKKQGKAINAKPIHNQGNQSKLNIHKQCSNQCSEKHRKAKTEEGNMIQKIELGGAGVI